MSRAAVKNSVCGNAAAIASYFAFLLLNRKHTAKIMKITPPNPPADAYNNGLSDIIMSNMLVEIITPLTCSSLLCTEPSSAIAQSFASTTTSIPSHEGMDSFILPSFLSRYSRSLSPCISNLSIRSFPSLSLTITEHDLSFPPSSNGIISISFLSAL